MSALPCRFSRLAFGGGEAGEMAAQEALVAHEARLTPGTTVRVYRGNPEGATGTIIGERGGRMYAIDCGDGLTWEVESRNLEVVDTAGSDAPVATREAWIERAGSLRAAVDYEQSALSIGREYLPAFAVVVLDGGAGSPEYWAWLADSLDEQEQESVEVQT